MGHEILYCTRCRTQLRSTDFEKELAYYLEGRPFCETCARDLVHTLPEERINEILNAFESTRNEPPPPPPALERPRRTTNCTTRIIRALAATSGPRMPTNSTRRMVLPASERISETALISGAAALVLAFGGLVILAGSGTTPPPPPAKPPAVERPAAYVSSHEPAAPAEDRVAKKIAAAYEFGRLNPDKLEKQIALFEEAGLEPGASRYSAELDAALRDLRRKASDRRAAALEPVEREMRAAIIRQNFKIAAVAVAAAQKRHLDPEWDRAVDRMGQELEAEIARSYQVLKNNALDARRRGASDEVRQLQDRLAGWGRPELSRDLEAALTSNR
jgi:hypothetical protein